MGVSESKSQGEENRLKSNSKYNMGKIDDIKSFMYSQLRKSAEDATSPQEILDKFPHNFNSPNICDMAIELWREFIGDKEGEDEEREREEELGLMVEEKSETRTAENEILTTISLDSELSGITRCGVTEEEEEKDQKEEKYEQFEKESKLKKQVNVSDKE